MCIKKVVTFELVILILNLLPLNFRRIKIQSNPVLVCSKFLSFAYNISICILLFDFNRLVRQQGGECPGRPPVIHISEDSSPS